MKDWNRLFTKGNLNGHETHGKFPTLVTREIEMKITKKEPFPTHCKGYEVQCLVLAKLWNTWSPYIFLVKMKMVERLWRTIWNFLRKSSTQLSTQVLWVPPPVGFDPILSCCFPSSMSSMSLFDYFHISSILFPSQMNSL